MHEETAPTATPQQHDTPRDIRRYFNGQLQGGQSPAEYHPATEPANGLEHLSPVKLFNKQESSEEDDAPLRDRRLHDPDQRGAAAMAVQGNRSFQKSTKKSPTSNSVAQKRPGPKPFAAKPIAKNDMKAKREVIRSIEKNWGKNFITKFIPKCHRPLQKHKGGKRTSYRVHESDPMKWLPSVLKAVLGISELTNDKDFLKQAMNDIVRHRIKHTGNRKPQLVTTDFDVIEDMVTRGWDIETSFSIRYKHLLHTHPKGYVETDEDIDHILACGDDESPHVSESEDNDQEDDCNDMEVDSQSDEADSAETRSPYWPKATYIQGGPYQRPKMVAPKQSNSSLPAKQEKQEKQERLKKATKVPKQSEISDPKTTASPSEQVPHVYGGYGMPGYGPFGGYGGNPSYPPMPGYPPPNIKGYPPHNPHGKSYPPMPPIYPWPAYGHYPGYAQQGSDKYKSVPGSSSQAHGYMPMGFPGFGYPGMPMYPSSPNVSPDAPAPSSTARPSGPMRFSPFGGSKRSSSQKPDVGIGRLEPSGRGPRIKRESGIEDHSIPIEDDNGTSNNVGEVDGEGQQMSDEQMRKEIEAQERHVEMLKAQLAKKSRG